MGQERLTGGSKGDGPIESIEETDTEVAFKALDLGRDRRLDVAEPRGGAAGSGMPSHLTEGGQFAEFHRSKISIARCEDSRWTRWDRRSTIAW